jgi:hypothetical protein
MVYRHLPLDVAAEPPRARRRRGAKHAAGGAVVGKGVNDGIAQARMRPLLSKKDRLGHCNSGTFNWTSGHSLT